MAQSNCSWMALEIHCSTACHSYSSSRKRWEGLGRAGMVSVNCEYC
jgi:hypothetical protein